MKKILSLLFLFNSFYPGISAQSANPKNQFNIDKAGLAIEGYDPVAYFISSKAIEGGKGIAYSWQGIEYRFSSVRNRDMFIVNPTRYQPQFGGWCAYAMGAKGEKVSIDPETFKILNGKLYLFYNSFFNNTLKEWNKNEANLKTSADKNWMKFHH